MKYKGLILMIVAFGINVAMLVWISLTLQEGWQYIKYTHNADSCLAGGWCGHIPVLMVAPFAFVIMLFLGCYGYDMQQKENEKLALERKETL